MGTRFLPGRRPRRAAARAVRRPIETARTSRRTRILRFTSAPTSPVARLILMVERVSRRRCGPFRLVFEQLEQPLAAAVCQEGIGYPCVEMPPPPSTQAVSELQAPPAPLVVKSVPPTEVT